MSEPKLSVRDLLYEPTRWDQLIAADLSAEIESLLSERIDTIPEMRRFLAIKGYRELHQSLKAAADGKSGEEALRAVAFAMRAYARDRPGLSAATFRNPTVDSPEWHHEGESLGRFVLGVFAGVGLTGDAAIHALRILRALVRGFVLHEMAASFIEPLDYDESYSMAVEVYIRGLTALHTAKK
ncbi:MAG: WHG domain-containing protein [Bradyrhizobium sp.]|uniref:TetR-like C-terminal domain-containing protein n=1 Tax=Bradyrhizobium sp. TaxID=376 RepID=UPI00120C7293|nr:TetR-like C-terminal domain-containing protein [Bradyrhizobium sp.]THD59010.1 MAG: WHG domain-containing protein [Bradyrhizobium sp.]